MQGSHCRQILNHAAQVRQSHGASAARHSASKPGKEVDLSAIGL
jgi:hypothetical protein